MKHPRQITFHSWLAGKAELKALKNSLKQKCPGGDGPACKNLEKSLSRRLKAQRVFLTPSGTAALEMAFMTLNLKPGEEVILPSFNFVSGANAILRAGGVPVFADVSINTLNLDPIDVCKRITRRTRAILLVHYAGVACDMKPFLAMRRRHRIVLIEDAALALGATWKGKPLGSLGSLGCFSFHATKQISCGEGGALAVSKSSPKLLAQLEIIREKGTDRTAFLRGDRDRYTWRGVGSSFVLCDLLAALLQVQVSRSVALGRKLLRAWRTYQKQLSPLEKSGMLRLCHPGPGAAPNGHLFWFVLDGPWAGKRQKVLSALHAHGIPATFHYVPLHSSLFGRRLRARLSLPITEKAGHDLVRLPLHAGLKSGDYLYICRCLSQILKAPNQR